MLSFRSCLPNLFIKAMWALRAFILLPLAAALRSTDGAVTTWPGPVRGHCLSKYENTKWAEANGREIRECRVTKKWEYCVGTCSWKSGKLKVPAGYCDHRYGKSKWAEEHGSDVSGCRRAARWHDCVGECTWVESSTNQPPEGYCWSKYEGMTWGSENPEGCRDIEDFEDCVGLCTWKEGQAPVTAAPTGYCENEYADTKWAETHGSEVTACRVVTTSIACSGNCLWYS